MIVKGERLKRAILLALADSELQKIMDAAVYESKSVSQIMEEMYHIVLPTERSGG
jgi:hypothetical protein